MAEKFLENGEFDIEDYVLKRLNRVIEDAYSGIVFDHTLDNVSNEELGRRIRDAVDKFWVNAPTRIVHESKIEAKRKEHAEAIAELDAWHDAEVAAGRLTEIVIHK